MSFIGIAALITGLLLVAATWGTEWAPMVGALIFLIVLSEYFTARPDKEEER